MRFLKQPRIRLGAVIALAAAAGIVAWAVIGASSDDTPSTTPPTTVARTGPVALSPEALRTLSQALGQPIYWAGRRRGYAYELTQTTTRKVYIRYLPPGVRAGAPGAAYLIVATYPFPNAFNALKRAAGGRELSLRSGGIAVVDANYPKSVHLAFPGVDYQVEVYDPSPRRSLQVARSGHVVPIAG